MPLASRLANYSKAVVVQSLQADQDLLVYPTGTAGHSLQPQHTDHDLQKFIIGEVSLLSFSRVRRFPGLSLDFTF